MILRKGKSKAILEASLDAALLAVEVYNKPRTTFRSQAYITLMIMAWTRLLHAYFNNSIGDKYYYKDKPNRYILIDGDKKAWELTECIKQYKKLSEPIKKNLEFFIKIRNKIEHRHIDPKEVDVSIFGECQSLLFNYENTLVQLFGNNYSINESLVYSLQFSQLRTTGQQKSGKSVLSKDTSEILSYIQKFKATLGDEVYASQEFSIKLLQIPIPKVSNNSRDTPAMEFVRWDALTDADKKDAYEKITTIIKDKKIITEAVNAKRLKPGQVVTKVNKLLSAINIQISNHTALWRIFSIRPENNADDPFETNTEFCIYDETHADYVYEPQWIDFIVHLLQSQQLTLGQIRIHDSKKDKLDIEKYKIN